MKLASPHSTKHRGGYALVLVIAFIAVVTGGIAAYLALSNSQARKSVKFSVQTQGSAMLENQMATLHSNARTQMESGATVDLNQWANLVTMQPSTSGASYTTSASVADGQSAVTASQGLGDLSSYLTQPDDPFRGARADVTSTTLVAKATRTKTNPYQSGAGQSDAPLNVVYNATVDWRRLPVSEWSYFSQGGTTLSASEFPGGNAGRAYVAKDAGISGGISTTYPFAAGGNILLDGNKASSSLTARSSPADTESFTLQSDTTEATWPEYARSIARSKVLSGRDIPLGLMRPASATDLTSPPEVDLGSDARNAQKLCNQCERIVMATRSMLQEVGGTPNMDFHVFDAQGVEYPVEAANFSAYVSPNQDNPPVMIVFDYTAQAALHQSYYFYVTDQLGGTKGGGSLDGSYALMVRHARVLQAPLSIVSPMDIYIENGIGDLAADGTSVTKPTVPVSLTTGNRRVYGIKSGW